MWCWPCISVFWRQDLSYHTGWDFYDSFWHVYLNSPWLCLVNSRLAKVPWGHTPTSGRFVSHFPPFRTWALPLLPPRSKAPCLLSWPHGGKYSSAEALRSASCLKRQSTFCADTEIVLTARVWREAALPHWWQIQQHFEMVTNHCFGSEALIIVTPLPSPKQHWRPL